MIWASPGRTHARTHAYTTMRTEPGTWLSARTGPDVYGTSSSRKYRVQGTDRLSPGPSVPPPSFLAPAVLPLPDRTGLDGPQLKSTEIARLKASMLSGRSNYNCGRTACISISVKYFSPAPPVRSPPPLHVSSLPPSPFKSCTSTWMISAGPCLTRLRPSFTLTLFWLSFQAFKSPIDPLIFRLQHFPSCSTWVSDISSSCPARLLQIIQVSSFRKLDNRKVYCQGHIVLWTKITFRSSTSFLINIVS